MTIQRLTKQQLLCTIGEVTKVYTYERGKKHVTIINTPFYTQVLTYKKREEQIKDTFDRIKTMCQRTRYTLVLTPYGNDMMFIYYNLSTESSH